MKIITGSARGRKIKTARTGVRPMAARVKKSVFDRLGNLCDARVLDVFAGSGALGIESLSRGANSVVFIEKNPAVANILCDNIQKCGFSDRCKVIRSDYEKAARRLRGERERFDLIFLDPPYALYKQTDEKQLSDAFAPLLSENGRIVIEYETGGGAEYESGGENCRTKNTAEQP